MINTEVIVENSKWKKKIRNIEFFFSNIIKNFPQKYRFKKKKVLLSLLLSSNYKIKILNKKFRNKNKPTDVLSFPINKSFSKNQIYLGDIIISYEYMNQPKKIKNLEFKKKVAKIFIHGFLHLVGYDHIKNKDYKKMNKEENKIYNLIEKKIA